MEARRTKELIENLFDGIYQHKRKKYSKISNKSRRVEGVNEVLSFIHWDVVEVYERGKTRETEE
jgi:hypothetical protein